MDYPETKRVAVTDTLHGLTVTDPYRWLENGDDPAVREWIDAQNDHARRTLDAIPGRERIRAMLERSLGIGSVGAPRRHGHRYFFTKREGNQNQPVLYCRDGLHEVARILVDPNEMSDDGAVTIDWWFPSREGRYVAYGLSHGGDEMSTLHLIDAGTGRALRDTIPRTRMASVAWLRSDDGFYYSRFPAPGEVPEGEEFYHNRIYFHRLGTDPREDPLVFGEGRDMHDWPHCSISEDGGHLVIHVHQGMSRNELYIRPLTGGDAAFIPVAMGIDAHFIGWIDGGYLYMKTDLDAPNYRILRTPLTDPSRKNWREVLPEHGSAIEYATTAGGRLFVTYLENATSVLYECALDAGSRRMTERTGTETQKNMLPGTGTIFDLEGRHDGTELFIGFTSFLVPDTIYRYDLETGELAVYDRAGGPAIDVSTFEVKQEWCTSKDGTRVPVFLVHRSGLRRDGTNPTILYGYGGFNISRTPLLLKSFLPWLELGGVFALAILRGGGEFGSAWHRAGSLENKQNVFDDFAAAASYLCGQHLTAPERLAIFGGSNGGLLVGATVTQHPGICRAAVCNVPVLDMARFHRFSVGRYWITEYGDPDDPEQFVFLMHYSPYHNVWDGVPYPAVLLSTADSDSRVDPMHAMKMTALLQRA
ncbi:MAG TPA: prolyl oligopeptidase family serine peptidase, partial [Patescibacteria group bacterium]|nr:prolyl oligopeptidase family serine peptidase [Patescibacteria group bacterium]